MTLVEAMDHILPTEDFETCAVLDQELRNAGIDIRVRTRAEALVKGADKVNATLVADKHQEEAVRQVVQLLREKGWDEYL